MIQVKNFKPISLDHGNTFLEQKKEKYSYYLSNNNTDLEKPFSIPESFPCILWIMENTETGTEYTNDFSVVSEEEIQEKINEYERSEE